MSERDGPEGVATAGQVAARTGVRFEELGDGIGAIVLEGGGAPFVLSPSTLGELEAAVERAGDGERRGLFFRNDHPSVFCAGADVNAMAALTSRADAEAIVVRGQRLFERIAHLPFPTVALIHGSCVGGGLELALACGARTATPDPETKLGLPEVQLGIIPAWGGCTRLPRLIGLEAAVALVTAGRTVAAEKARRLGIVDSVVPREHLLREGARLVVSLARGTLQRPRAGLRRTLLTSTAPGRMLVSALAGRAIARETKGRYPAPAAALRAMVGGLGERVDESLARERKEVLDLLESPVHKNLLRLFRITQVGQRPPVYRLGMEAPAPVEIAVIGAGVMGAGIAGVMVGRGLSVRLIDPVPAALGKAWQRIRADLDALVARRAITGAEALMRLSRFTVSTVIDGIGRADLVLEAASEKRELKLDILARAEKAAGPHAIIATNTSSFPIGELATAVPDPTRLVGLHFFNPPAKMPLLEIVRGPLTSDATVGVGLRLAQILGKTPVVVGDGPGFLVNRLLAPYLLEACRLVEEGLGIEVIDDAIRDYGLPMGPFRLMDEVGLDIILDATRSMGTREGYAFAPHPLIEGLVARKMLGRKTGAGFYHYRGKKRAPSDAYRELARGHARREAGAAMGADAIARRLIGRMAAEARRVLGEGLVLTPEDVDIATVYGIGYPPWRGGLLHDMETQPARAPEGAPS